MDEELDKKFIRETSIEIRKNEFDTTEPERLSPETNFQWNQFLNHGEFFVRMIEDLNYWKTAKKFKEKFAGFHSRLKKIAEEGEREHDRQQKHKTGRVIKVPRK